MACALVKIRFVGVVFPPTAPENDTFPSVPAVNVKVLPTVQFSVFEKLMFAPAGLAPAFVLSNVRAPVRATGPVIAMIPLLVVMFPAILIAVDATEEAV
jgi:hypothetical protein